MDTAWSPRLDVTRAHGRCRLRLGGYAHGDGDTLQAAADALVARVLEAAIAWRSGSFRFPAELGPIDLRWFEFLQELGELAAAGGNVRERILGLPARANPAA